MLLLSEDVSASHRNFTLENKYEHWRFKTLEIIKCTARSVILIPRFVRLYEEIIREL